MHPEIDNTEQPTLNTMRLSTVNQANKVKEMTKVGFLSFLLGVDDFLVEATLELRMAAGPTGAT